MHCVFVPVVRPPLEDRRITGDVSVDHAPLFHISLSREPKPPYPASYEMLIEVDTGKIFISDINGEWIWQWKLQKAPTQP